MHRLCLDRRGIEKDLQDNVEYEKTQRSRWILQVLLKYPHHFESWLGHEQRNQKD